MSLPDGPAPDDQLLVRYLIGSVADDEAERLDELSIADDQFASHLSAVENDLVDAYVKGELSGDTLNRFRAHYLSSPVNTEKVQFARTFLKYQSTAASKPAHAAAGRRGFALPRAVPQWGWAAAALLILMGSGYLLVDNLRLRNQVTDSGAARERLAERERELQTQLNEQRSAQSETVKELARALESLARLEGRSASNPQASSAPVLSFILLPAIRGAGDITTVAIPDGTDRITLQLKLEADDFPRFRVALKDPASDQIVWRSANLQATSKGDAKSLSITLEAKLLKSQTYTIELTGVPERGAAELVSSYPFRVVIR